MPADRGDNSTAPESDRALSPDELAVRNRGLRALGDNLIKITDRVVTSLHVSEPAYRHGVPPAELQMAKSINEVLQTCLRPAEQRADSTAWPREVGSRRAQQGVPLKAMLRAYRIGGQELFGTFFQWATDDGLPRDRVAAVAGDLWTVVDLHCAAAATAFRATEFELSGGHLAEEAGHLLDDLLDGDAGPDGVAGAAQAWALAEQARYAVVVCRPADWYALPLEQEELPGRLAGIRVIWRLWGGCAFGIVALGDASTVEIARMLPARHGRCVGVSLPMGTLADLGRARRLAELAARSLTDGDGVACLEDRLPVALLTTRPDLALELCMQALGPVLTLDGVSRNLLLDTLTAWLAAGGSAYRAGTGLKCPWQVVLTRLRWLEQLTGRSPFGPEDLLELGLALEAFDLWRLATGLTSPGAD